MTSNSPNIQFYDHFKFRNPKNWGFGIFGKGFGQTVKAHGFAIKRVYAQHFLGATGQNFENKNFLPKTLSRCGIILGHLGGNFFSQWLTCPSIETRNSVIKLIPINTYKFKMKNYRYICFQYHLGAPFRAFFKFHLIPKNSRSLN